MKELEVLAAEQKPMVVSSDPSESQFSDLTEVIYIPTKKFPTEDDVIESNGYERLDQINSGAYGEVFRARHKKSGLIVAFKRMIIAMTDDKMKRRKEYDIEMSKAKDVKNELYALEKMKHPNVIRMIRHFIVKKGHTHFMFVLM